MLLNRLLILIIYEKTKQKVRQMPSSHYLVACSVIFYELFTWTDVLLTAAGETAEVTSTFVWSRLTNEMDKMENVDLHCKF